MDDLELVIFDLAGTIIKPAPPVEIQYESEARKILPSEHIPPRRMIRKRFRVAFQSMGPYEGELRYGTTHTTGFYFWKRIIGAVFPTIGDQQLQDLSEKLYEKFKYEASWVILEGAKSVLERLADKSIKLGLLTNWDKRCRELLNNLELNQFFDGVYISSEVGKEKPDPSFFMEPVKNFDTETSHTLMVGNQPDEDLTPAQDIGMDTLLVLEDDGSTTSDHLWSNVAHSWIDVANRVTQELA